MSQLSTEPPLPSISVRYEPRTRPFRRYLTFYALAMLGFALMWGAINGILLPLQVQQLEFAHYFTGADAATDLQKLTELQTQAAAGTVTPTAEQTRLLHLLAEYNVAKAGGLSIVTSAAVVVTMILLPIIGTLSDRTRSRWGRRAPWVLGGGITGAALLILMPAAPSLAVLVIIWSLASLVINVAQGPASTTVADRVPSERIGLASMISGLLAYGGVVVGSVLAGVLFNAVGLGAYIPFAIFLAVAVVLFALIARDKSSKELVAPKLGVSTLFLSFVTALRDRDYRWAWIAKVILFAGYQISAVYPIYMLQSYVSPALSESQAATTAPLLSLAGVPGALVAMAISGRWSDKIGRRKPFVIAASVIMAVSFLVPLVWPSLPAMFIQAIVLGFGFGMFIVVDQALFIEVLPDREAAGRDLGLAQLGTNLGQAVGPAIGGLVVVVFAGAYGPIWAVSSVLVLVSAVLIAPIKRVR